MRKLERNPQQHMNRIGRLSKYKNRGEKKHATQRDATENAKRVMEMGNNVKKSKMKWLKNMCVYLLNQLENFQTKRLSWRLVDNQNQKDGVCAEWVIGVDPQQHPRRTASGGREGQGWGHAVAVDRRVFDPEEKKGIGRISTNHSVLGTCEPQKSKKKQKKLPKNTLSKVELNCGASCTRNPPLGATSSP